jgi:hypothetical protein
MDRVWRSVVRFKADPDPFNGKDPDSIPGTCKGAYEAIRLDLFNFVSSEDLLP